MNLLTTTIFITLILVILIVVLLKLTSNISKTCVCNFSVSDKMPEISEKLKLLLDDYLGKDLYIVIIQDDIKFSNTSFYWPKGCAFIHLSDALYFYKRLSSNNYTLSELQFFIGRKILII